MLKIKLNNTVMSYQEIEYRSLGVASDLSYISGICDASYHLTDESVLKVVTPYEPDGYETNIFTEEYTVQGTVTISTKYNIITSDDTIGILYHDGTYYYNRTYDLEHIYLSENEKYLINLAYGFVEIPDVYELSGDELISHDGKVFSVYIERDMTDGVISTSCVLKDSEDVLFEPMAVNMYEKPMVFTKFKIPNSKNINLDIEYASALQVNSYVSYANQRYDIYDGKVKINDNLSGETIWDTTVQLEDGTLLSINHEYADSFYGTYMSLYLDTTNVKVQIGDIIDATSCSTEKHMILLTDGVSDEGADIGEAAYINGHFYPKEEMTEDGYYYDFAIIGDDEYEIKYNRQESTYDVGNVSWGNEFEITVYRSGQTLAEISAHTSGATLSVDSYDRLIIDYGDRRMMISCDKVDDKYIVAYPTKTIGEIWFSGKTMSSITTYSCEVYGVKRYDFVSYGNNRYKVYSNDRYIIDDTLNSNDGFYLEGIDYISLNVDEKYSLVVDDIESPNILRVTAFMNDDYRVTETDYIRYAVVSNLVTNYKKYLFSLRNQGLGEDGSNDFNAGGENNGNVTLKKDELKLYKKRFFFNMPIGVFQSTALDLRKSDMVQSFINDQTNSAINPITDMDKDMYSPIYIQSNNEFLASSLEFRLHFRTRNLTDWKINESENQVVEYSENNDEVVTTLLSGGCGWFSTDFYNSANRGEACKYSDLLGFLNFSNNDVLYQKKKLAKTFLRLEFYDSPNIMTNSLLYQSTIWFDTSRMYKKYADGNTNTSNYKNILYNNTQNYPSVFSEEDNDSHAGYYEFSSPTRLDSTFYVSNSIENGLSSEGFYLYLFKDMTIGTKPSTIYMKVTFNHAGEGQSCLMYIPKKNNVRITEFNDNNIKEMALGVPMSGLTESMFIPITIKFNEEFNRFTYKFGDGLYDIDNGNIIFNLFEMKAFDEYAKPKLS